MPWPCCCDPDVKCNCTPANATWREPLSDEAWSYGTGIEYGDNKLRLSTAANSDTRWACQSVELVPGRNYELFATATGDFDFDLYVQIQGYQAWTSDGATWTTDGADYWCEESSALCFTPTTTSVTICVGFVGVTGEVGDGVAVARICLCDIGTQPVTPACVELFDNLAEETVIQHSMTGLGDNNLCDECDDLNTTYGLTWDTGCCWRYSAPHCVVGDGGVVFSRFCATRIVFTQEVRCELRFEVSRIDVDQDGNPPAFATGGVSATYVAVLPPSTTTLPNPLELQRVTFDHDAGNGPCTFNSPASVEISF